MARAVVGRGRGGGVGVGGGGQAAARIVGELGPAPQRVGDPGRAAARVVVGAGDVAQRVFLRGPIPAGVVSVRPGLAQAVGLGQDIVAGIVGVGGSAAQRIGHPQRVAVGVGHGDDGAAIGVGDGGSAVGDVVGVLSGVAGEIRDGLEPAVGIVGARARHEAAAIDFLGQQVGGVILVLRRQRDSGIRHADQIAGPVVAVPVGVAQRVGNLRGPARGVAQERHAEPAGAGSDPVRRHGEQVPVQVLNRLERSVRADLVDPAIGVGVGIQGGVVRCPEVAREAVEVGRGVVDHLAAVRGQRAERAGLGCVLHVQQQVERDGLAEARDANSIRGGERRIGRKAGRCRALRSWSNHLDVAPGCVTLYFLHDLRWRGTKASACIRPGELFRR